MTGSLQAVTHHSQGRNAPGCVSRRRLASFFSTAGRFTVTSGPRRSSNRSRNASPATVSVMRSLPLLSSSTWLDGIVLGHPAPVRTDGEGDGSRCRRPAPGDAVGAAAGFTGGAGGLPVGARLRCGRRGSVSTLSAGMAVRLEVPVAGVVEHRRSGRRRASDVASRAGGVVRDLDLLDVVTRALHVVEQQRRVELDRHAAVGAAERVGQLVERARQRTAVVGAGHREQRAAGGQQRQARRWR